MIILMPSHIFRQAQYDLIRCQSELVEDSASTDNNVERTKSAHEYIG